MWWSQQLFPEWRDIWVPWWREHLRSVLPLLLPRILQLLKCWELPTGLSLATGSWSQKGRVEGEWAGHLRGCGGLWRTVEGGPQQPFSPGVWHWAVAKPKVNILSSLPWLSSDLHYSEFYLWLLFATFLTLSSLAPPVEGQKPTWGGAQRVPLFTVMRAVH